ncbi:NAD(P)-dependent oxidoreductase, partial [Rhizobium ruizarguesonis]
MGVVVVGRIGTAVVNRLKPFGFRILGYDPVQNATRLVICREMQGDDIRLGEEVVKPVGAFIADRLLMTWRMAGI